MIKDKKIKKAFITGITGQDGSYLADLLLEKGYEVHGLIRRASTFNTSRVEHLYKDPHMRGVKFFLHYGDLSDPTSLFALLKRIKPDEIYHLGAQSHVRVSFDMPEYTCDITAMGTLRLLEIIRYLNPKIKFYQACSSEMYGNPSVSPPYSENTPFNPQSPYACSKVFTYHITRHYREAHGIFACCGILFNHESPRRGETFVTRKITRGIARIKAGLDKKIYLGNLGAKRDWGYAPEYVEAMWLMLQQKRPDDYVIATGQTHSIKEFLEKAFKYAGLGDWKKYVEIDQRYFRPTDVNVLIGDITKAKNKLGWKPKVKFKELVKIMVDADIKLLKK